MTNRGVRGALLAGTARQLGNPHGLVGRYVVANRLNRGNRESVAAAVDALAVANGQTVADIGFGGGVGLRMLLDKVGPRGAVHGVDISPTMVDRARRTFRADVRRLTLHAGSITALPLPDNTIDGAICVNTMYFVDDLDGAFAEVARTLRPGGRLVLGIADVSFLAKLPFTWYGFALRDVETYRRALAGAGLVVKEHRTFSVGHLLVAEADAA